MNLGIDIGATFIKSALVSANGSLVNEQVLPTPLSGPSDVVELITSMVASCGTVDGVGIGVPGVVDALGTVHHPPNLPGWTVVPLQTILATRLSVPVAVDNDANAAAMAELRFGIVATSSFLYVTLGTGVGGAIVYNGAILRGATGGAGEFGHVVVRWNDTFTTTGHTWRAGTVEEYVGSHALERAAGCSIRVLSDQVSEGNPSAVALLHTTADILAAGIASVMAIVAIPTIVVGGGVASALPPLLPLLEQRLVTRAIPSLQPVCVLPATFGNHAGCIGAAALLSKQH